MSDTELTQRLLSLESKIDSMKMRTGDWNAQDYERLSKAVAVISSVPIYIDDSPQLTVLDIRARARREKPCSRLGLIVVDYLQLMTGRSRAEDRQVEIAEISRGLKLLARELEVPVFALSQLSRNLGQRVDKWPTLADPRESGSLGQDADVALFLYRDEMCDPDSTDRGTTEIIVAKHRSGPTGLARLAFRDSFTKFANLAQR